MEDQTNTNPTTPPSSSPRGGTTLSDADGILNVDEARKFAQGIAASLLGDKCDNILILDVTKLSPVTGFIVIGSGTSARQMRSALENLDEVAEQFNTSVFKISNDNDALWLLADFVDVVVHVFEPNARAHYDLESMWPQAPQVELLPQGRPSSPASESSP